LDLDILRKKKSLEILSILIRGAKGIRETRRAVGGSYKTIYLRINELEKAGLITLEVLGAGLFGPKPNEKRLIRITNSGKQLIQSLKEVGFDVKPLLLRKMRERWMIAMLHILNGVSGTTRFMKLLFLLKQESGLTKKELSEFYKFRAGKYGPFSRGVSDDLVELEEDGLINTEIRRFFSTDFNEESSYLHFYSLADHPDDIVKEALTNLTISVLDKIKKLTIFNEIPLKQLLRYVYTKYPDYITNSLIVEKVLGGDKSL